jgi:3',5'-cyclic AMP phosphodiesterase CpdA
VPGRLLAVSDLHVAFPDNQEFVANLRPVSPHDWLLVAGDVAEKTTDIEWALRTLRARFAAVIWVPGNHELWTLSTDPVQLRGEARYQYLVSMCRGLGVITPEDPYPVWWGMGEPVVIVPLFVLYDYTFRPEGTTTKAESLALAYETGIVCSDEAVLYHDPYPSREAWCQARVKATERRLAAIQQGIPTVLVSHFPLTREPTRILKYPEFAQWCGTERTADWHLRYGAQVVVYGHLHIPGTSWEDGVRFEEVSLGYPQELDLYPDRPRALRQILPAAPAGNQAGSTIAVTKNP